MESGYEKMQICNFFTAMVLILEPFSQKKTTLSIKGTMFDQIVCVKLKIKEKDEGVIINCVKRGNG